jgi:hypothetical protein
MAKRMFEFRCVKDHISEKFVDGEVMVVECPHCRNDASRIISSPRIRLEGITGAFPTAYDAWERKHTEATRVAQKRNAE